MKCLKKFASYCLATMLTLATIPSIELFAATNTAVPTWTSAQKVSGKQEVYLNWDTPIPASDYFCKEDFEKHTFDYTGLSGGTYRINTTEEGDGIWRDPQGTNISGVNNNWTNSVRIADGLGRTGRGVKFKDTYHYPVQYCHTKLDIYGTPEDLSSLHQSGVNVTKNLTNDEYYKDPNSFYKVKLKEGRKIIISSDIKGTANHMWVTMTGGAPGTTYTGNWCYDESLSATELSNKLATQGSKIKIRPKDGYNPDSSYRELTCNIVPRKTPSNVPNYDYRYFSNVYSIYKENGQWYLSTDSGTIAQAWYDGVLYDLRPGEINKYVWSTIFNKPDVITPVYENVTVESVNPGDFLVWLVPDYGILAYDANLNFPDWTTISKNVDSSSISSFSEYFARIRLSCDTSTEFFMDNIRFAYAPKSRLYRNGTLLTDDYTVEYTDKTMKDLAAPNPPTVPSATITADKTKVNVKWNAPNDNGTDITYAVSSVNSDGIESAKASKTLNYASGIKTYRVFYNGTSKDTTDLNIDIPVSSFKDVSVAAIDYDGNISAKTVVTGISITAQNSISSKTISKFTKSDALNLPATNTVTTDKGTISLPITWDTSNYDSEANSVTLTGTYTLYNGMTNPSNLKPSITINLSDVTVSELANIITYPAEPNEISIDTVYKKDIDLSQYRTTKVKVHSNGTIKSDVPVTWDKSTLDLNTLSTYKVYGTVSDGAGFTIAPTVKPFIKVHVNESDLVSVETLPNKEIDAYSAFEQLNLPSKIDVTFDNGLTEQCSVTWSESDYDKTSLTSQVIHGNITLPYGYKNSTNTKATISVEVKPLEISSITQPDSSNSSNKLYITSLFESPFPSGEVASKIEVTGKNGYKESLDVTFNTSEFNPTQLGEQTVTGTFTNIPDYIDATTLPTPMVTINVVASDAVSVATIPNKEIEVYGTFESLNLPSTIDVTYSNGLTKASTITWDTSTFNSTTPTNHLPITGTLSIPAGYTNTSNLKATVSVKVKPANSCDIDVPDANNTENGLYHNVLFKAPISSITLPPTVRVIVSASHYEDIQVEFDTSTYNPELLGEQHISGTFRNIPSTVDAATLPIPEAIINVKPADVSSIFALGTTSGIPALTPLEDLDFQETIPVIFSNGDSISCQVTWDTSAYDKYSIESQTFSGTLTLPYGYINSMNIKAFKTIQLEPKYLNKFYTDNLSQTVEYGTSIENIQFPTTIVYEDSDENKFTFDMSVRTSSYDRFSLGERILGIDVNAPNYITFSNGMVGNNRSPEYKITVVPTDIVSIHSEQPEFTDSYGAKASKFNLPDEVTVRLGSGIDYKLPVTWDTSTYKNNVDYQELTGTIGLNEGITNTKSLKYKAKIILNKVEEGKEVINIKPIENITTIPNCNTGYLPLPYEVPVELSSGEVINVHVESWDLSTLDPSKPGTYYVKAILSSSSEFNLPTGMEVWQKIIIEPTATNGIVQLVPLTPIEVLPNEEYTLPTKALAIMADGTCKEVSIVFEDVIDTLSGYGVHYQVAKVVGEANPFDLKLIQEVDVVDIFEKNPTVVEVKPPVTVNAYVGQPYAELRFNKVPVRLSNNRWHYALASLSPEHYDNTKVGYISALGDIQCSTAFTNPKGLKTMVSVNVKERTEESNTLTIEKLLEVNKVTVDYGTPYQQITLDNAKVLLSNGEILSVPVYWDLSSYTTTTVGKMTITGNLDTNIPNPLGVKGQTELNILVDNRDPAGDKTVTNLPTTITGIDIKKGTVLSTKDLPTEIECTLRNGDKVKVPVVWDYKAQSITKDTVIKGKLIVPEGMYITCDDDIEITINCNKSPSSSSDNTNSNTQPSRPSGGSGGSGGSPSTEQTQEKPATKPQEQTQEKPATKPQQSQVQEDKPATKAQESSSSPTENTSSSNKPGVTKPTKEFTGEQLFSQDLSKVPYTVPNVSNLKNSYQNGNNSLVLSQKDNSVIQAIYTNTYLNKKEVMDCKVVNATPSSQTFKDVTSKHWAYNSIMEMTKRGYANGKSNNEFKPSDVITVGDTCTFLDRVLLNNNHFEILNDRDYIDSHIKSKDHWAYYNVASIASKTSQGTINNILAITSKSSYDRPLTREEVAVIFYDVLTRCKIELPVVQTSVNYNDKSLITRKAEVEYCTKVGIFKGDNAHNFNPTNNITRAELMTTLIRLDDMLN